MEDQKINILLIEDNPDDAFLIQQMLAEVGEPFAWAHTERLSTGLEHLTANSLDAVLLDLGLPDSQGMDTLVRVHALAPRVPIVVLSGLDDEILAVKAVSGGAQDYLVKGQADGHLLARAIRYAIERKQVEEALRQLNATLEAQVQARTAEIVAEKEKGETILRNIGDAILMTDLEMQIQYVNEAFTALTGYPAAEALGQQVYALMRGEMPEQTLRSLRLALRKGETWQGEMTARRKDGRAYEATLTVAPVRDAKGQLVGYVSRHEDISRRKELERARNQFITNVSHELRTPVTNMKLYASLLRKKRRPEKTEGYFQVLEEQTDRLSALIQDILEITELDSGQAVMVWEPVSLASVIDNAVTRYQSRAEASGLTLIAGPVPSDLPVVKGNQARLTQALNELVENAVIFTPAGERVTVEVEAVEKDGQRWVTLAVRDTGPGISAEEQAKVFDRFFRGRLAESGNIPGTGLGLSTAQEIARAHGGRVTVESELGQGSTFKIWLLLENDR